MNRGKRGQMVGAGALIALAITLIVGAILLQASAQQVGTVTNTVSVANASLGTAVNGTLLYLTDYKSISDVVVYNDTSSVVDSDEYTLTNNVVYNGAEAITVLPASPADSGVTGYTWYISGTAQPLTYIDSSGARSMSSLIIVMTALALVSVAVGFAVKQKYD
jgi:hypothetical protein